MLIKQTQGQSEPRSECVHLCQGRGEGGGGGEWVGAVRTPSPHHRLTAALYRAEPRELPGHVYAPSQQ